MIYTVTFAPAVDYVIDNPQAFDAQGLNRVRACDFVAGGKGINAAVVLKRLGFAVTAIAFLGEPTAVFFKQLLAREKIDLIALTASAPTRINVKYRGPDCAFEINGAHPRIEPRVLRRFFQTVANMTEADCVMIMGAADPTVLTRLVRTLHRKKIKFVLDVDAKIVPDLLPCRPLAFKPNVDEIFSCFGERIKTRAEIHRMLIRLRAMGVVFPIISAGKEGCYFLEPDFKTARQTKPPNGFVLRQVMPPRLPVAVNATGAGDTLLAGFVGFHFINGEDPVRAVRKATALAAGTVAGK